MQLEEEYRRRWHEVTSEVTRRLDYQVSLLSLSLSFPLSLSVSLCLSPSLSLCLMLCLCVQLEVQNVQKALEHSHLVQWLEKSVIDNIKGQEVSDPYPSISTHLPPSLPPSLPYRMPVSIAALQI